MDIFSGLTLLGGLSLFLFGMSLMGQALEKRAGGKLRGILERMTGNKLAGFITGCGVTAVIQSSSATTVMVVGFVNSGLMTLKQAINVIMGANVGTTVTSWILSLSGISSKNIWIRMLKPSSFTPILALIGIILYMFFEKSEKKDTGMILLGFATLMFGMETMSGAVSGLAAVPAFQQLFIMFQNPLLGLLAGAILTAIIQSSSASVGILQALSTTGQVSVGAAIPIIMGQNIGTCVTAIISSVGANKNAKRASVVHLMFNVIGSVSMLIVFSAWKWLFTPSLLNNVATTFEIAIIHTIFNIICVMLLLPNAGLLEKIAKKVIPEDEKQEVTEELDPRLLGTPALALEQCRMLSLKMADTAVSALKSAIASISNYTPETAQSIRDSEDLCDHYEDIIGTYLVSLSSRALSMNDSEEATALLKMIGDFERISDHAVNVLESAEELRNKKLSFTEKAMQELDVLSGAVDEVMDMTYQAFSGKDAGFALNIEALEQVVDRIKEQLRTQHIRRMQDGKCSIEVGFVWSDLLTNLERASDHCCNIAGCIVDVKEHKLDLHQMQNRTIRDNKLYMELYTAYSQKYLINIE